MCCDTSEQCGGLSEVTVLKQTDLTAGRPSEQGFMAVEAIFACLVVMLFASVAIPRAAAFYREAVLEYELQSLLSDIRYMRELSRSTEARPAEVGWDYNGERERRAGMYFQHEGYVLIAGSHIFREHKYVSGIRMSGPMVSDSNTKQQLLMFGDDGVLSKPCTLYLFWSEQQSCGRRLILSAGGRCRVERGRP